VIVVVDYGASNLKSIVRGLERAGAVDSPIAGAEGNREFFLHLRSRS